MTFEEKLAAHGRKMDEMKAKIDEAVSARKEERQKNREELAAEIARLDAAYDEFEAALDAQIETQLDTLNAQIEKQTDKLDAQIDKQKKDAAAAADLAEEEFERGVAKVKAAFTLDREAVEELANEPTGIDRIQKGMEEQVARAKGDIAVAKENALRERELYDSKRESVKLRTQMRVNNAKEKISARKEAVDKAAQEEWILDLLDYAEGCYEMAYSWMLEAEYTMMEAAYEMDYYVERFGKEE